MTASPVRRALQNTRLLLVVSVAITLEVVIRLALGHSYHPFLYLLTPPIAGFLWLGLAAPDLRGNDNDAGIQSLADVPFGILGRLALIAVFGHAVAVALGTALFFALDTPVQAALYWLDVHYRPPIVMFAWPITGVFLGMSIIWTGPALVGVAVADGMSLREATLDALVAIPSRGFLTLVGRNLLVGVAIMIALPLVGIGASPDPVLVEIAFGVLFFVLLVTVFIGALVSGFRQYIRNTDAGVEFPKDGEATESADESVGGLDTGGSQTVPVLAIIVLSLALLGLGALGASVRMAELTPESSTEALGSNSDDIYASAVHNSFSGSYRAVRTDIGDEGNETTEWAVDPVDRELSFEHQWKGYVSPSIEQRWLPGSRYPEVTLQRTIISVDESDGAITPGNYFRARRVMLDRLFRSDDEVLSVSGWDIVRETDDEIVLSLANASAHRAVGLNLNDGFVPQYRVEAVVDPHRRVLESLEFQTWEMNTTSGNTTIIGHSLYRFEYDIDVERPDSLGAPSIDEYVWRALIY